MVALFAGAAFSGLFWQPVDAETTQTQATAGNIEEVVVTARRRSEDVQKVPISLSVATGEFLEQHQITDYYSLQKVTPSLGVQSSNTEVGSPTFSIRGIGTGLTSPTTESSVGVVIDDVPIARSELADIQLFDLDRVETLYGPQGMLFGKNASAGVINVVTKNPQLGETEFLAHGDYGSMNTPNAGNSGKVDLAANIPVANDMAIRIDGFFTHYDGFVKNLLEPNQFLGENQFGTRAKMLWEPTSALRILVTGDYAYENGPGESLQPHSFDSPTASHGLLTALCLAGGGPPPACAAAGAPGPGVLAGIDAAAGITASRQNDLIAATGPQSYHYAIWGLTGKVDYDLGGGYTLTNIAAARATHRHLFEDISGTPNSFLYDLVDYKYSQFSEELRIASPTDQRFSYQAGFYYQHLHADYDQPGISVANYDNFGYSPSSLPPGIPCIGCNNTFYHFQSDSTAGYAEGTFKILDSLRLTAGGRFTHDTMAEQAVIQNNPLSYVNFYSNETLAGTNEKYNLSGRASLDYDITDDVMAYVSAARGYKGPSLNQADASKIGDEIPEDYEIGVKSTFLDHRLQLNVNGFDETFYGYQQLVIGVSPSGNIIANVVNAGKLKSRGAEVQFTAIPLDGLTVSGAMTYNDAFYVGLALPCLSFQPLGTAANQCNVPAGFPPFLGSTNVSGNQLALAPRWTETATVRYERPVWDGWTGFIQGDGYFKSKYNYNVIEDPNTEIGSTAILGASIGANSDDGHWGFALYVHNLTNQRIPLFMYENGVGNLTGGLACGLPLAALHAFGPAVAEAFFGCGDNINPARGDYSAQLGPDSFRSVGLTLDYHM